MIIILFLFLHCLSSVSAFEHLKIPSSNMTLFEERQLFEAYIERYNKAYESNEEKEMRFNVFRETLKEIDELNEESALSNSPDRAVFGLTIFSDITNEEFHKYYLSNYDKEKIFEENVDGINIIDAEEVYPASEMVDDYPSNFSWVDKNCVVVPKAQLDCGSCWIFSSVSITESQYCIKTGNLVSLSEQQILDCFTGSSCTSGGYYTEALAYIKKYGLETESYYPYYATPQSCKYDKGFVVLKIDNAYRIQNTELYMKNWLYDHGVIGVYLNAEKLKSYQSGVFDSACSSKINHAVNLVGYGLVTSNYGFWVVKNSWSTSWGENGFFRIRRGVHKCGIATVGFQPSF